MVVIIEKYKDEVSGKLFATYEVAWASEYRNAEIRDSFSFYDPVEDKTGDFANGKLCIQRTEEFYNRLLDTLVAMIEMYEPRLAERYIEKTGSFSREDVKGRSFVGRWLDDGDSNLSRWWYIQCSICPLCFREYGQIYHALHCNHDTSVITKTRKDQ